MRFWLSVPGRPEAIAGPFPSIGEAVAARDAMWRGAWGGQPILIVDDHGGMVRPCLTCRGTASALVGDRFELEAAEPCGHCGGTGIDPDAPMHPAHG